MGNKGYKVESFEKLSVIEKILQDGLWNSTN
jgi:hypothetical protein